MVDTNEIVGWIEHCPSPALLIHLKSQIDDRLRYLKDSQAMQELHPQLKKHVPEPFSPPPPITQEIKAEEIELVEAMKVHNPYEVFGV